MQHLPVPATGAAHSLDGWHHRGSPPSLHARVRYWPAKWGRSQNAAVDFHFSSPLYSFRIQKKMDSCSEHYTLWNLIILDFFNHLYLRTLQFFFLDVFCMDLVKERMLCTLLHCISILLKCEMKGLYIETNVSESTRWSFVVVFPFVLVMPPNISNVNHQYFEGEKWM